MTGLVRAEVWSGMRRCECLDWAGYHEEDARSQCPGWFWMDEVRVNRLREAKSLVQDDLGRPEILHLWGKQQAGLMPARSSQPSGEMEAEGHGGNLQCLEDFTEAVFELGRRGHWDNLYSCLSTNHVLSVSEADH